MVTSSSQRRAARNPNPAAAKAPATAPDGKPVISSIGIRGNPQQILPGFHAVDRAGAIADMMRPLKVAVNAISIMAGLLWLVAALIVGSMIYVSALERTRDFAVFKAVGVPTRSILSGLAMQAVIVALLAALSAHVISVFFYW